jgi:phosphatidylglycerol:prolipoprotein diacylglycerol transferase
MHYLNYIVWDPQPEIFSIGSWEMRWYGLFFALGFLIAQQIMFYIYRKEGKPERDVEALTFFMVIATILGARLGHVLFYEPDKYLSNPLSILKVWEGGLASHGGAFGILIAIYLYVHYLIRIDFGTFEIKKRKRSGQNYMWVVDRLVIVVALVGALIRLGNFMNSEIVGVQTDAPYGVVFAHNPEELLKVYGQGAIAEIEAEKPSDAASLSMKNPVQLNMVFERGINEATAKLLIEENISQAFSKSERLQEDLTLAGEQLNYTIDQNRGVVSARLLTEGVSRHPAQLYESISSLLIFILLFYIWSRRKAQTRPGLLFGIFLILLFGLRFLYEFLKENQVDFEDELALNMGQILSIPLVIAGIIILVRSFQKKFKPVKEEKEPLITSGS